MIEDGVRAQLLYDAQKKSVALAYVFWFFFWSISMHRLYLHKWLTALIQAGMGGTALFLMFSAFFPRSDGNLVVLGWVLLVMWGLSLFFDLFTIPGWVRRYNVRLVDRVG